ncbi:MAG: hypothetical protein ABUL72_03215, partial [Armatimonadota bacterium]
PGHIYPSYLPECNVCADLRSRGQAIPQAMVNTDTSDAPIEESAWPKIVLFSVVALVIAIGVFGVMRQTGEPQTSQVAQKTTPSATDNSKPPQPVPKSATKTTPAAPLPTGVPLQVPTGSPYTGEDGRVRLVVGGPYDRVLPMPSATRGAFKAQDGDLAGHWEIQQADVGGTVMNIDISPIGDSYSAYVQGGVHTPRPNNLSVTEYDGTRLLIQENWSMLGGTDYLLQRVGPQLFEGTASFNGHKLFPIKMIRVFE